MAKAAVNFGIAPDAFWHKPQVVRPDDADEDRANGATVDVVQGEAPPGLNEQTGTLHIPTEDGGLIVDFSGKPAEDDDDESDSNKNFDANLAETLDPMVLSTIAEDLLEGIDADIQTRSEWIETRARALDLLGIKLDPPRSSPGGSGAAPLEGMSTAKDPAMLDAVVRGQANAIGEFLPAEGPVKIDDVGDVPDDEDAELLEKDFNYYLTSTATEYVPDTRRMFAWIYFGGSGIKKVYHCPLRRRPVSESIEMQNFIVSNAATDLNNADRATHLCEMRRSEYLRMVAAKVYVDVATIAPTSPAKDRVTEKTETITGTRADSTRPEDQPYTLYECYCERAIDSDHMVPAHLKKAGVPVPYRVTIEKDSRQIVDLRRHWKPDDTEARRKKVFVKYSFVDWMGFYGIGLLHLMGNLTLALTAMLRIGIDRGMFANFPGGLTAKSITRQEKNDFVIGPGQFPGVDLAGLDDIRKVVMAMPYTDVTSGMLQLMDKVREVAKQVGGTADMPVAEGRADIPVGTILALIEQSTKVESAVHKGMHQSASEEFALFIELFREDPEAFWRHQPKSKQARSSWNKEKLIAALDNVDLVPRSDPNTPSHIHRIMRAVALVQMAEGAAAKGFNRFDMEKIYKQALTVLRYGNPDQYFLPPAPPPDKPDPKDIEAEAKLTTAKAKELDTQVKAQTAEQSVKEKLLGHVSDEKIATLGLEKERVIHEHDAAKDKAEHGLKAQAQQHGQAMDVAGHGLDAAKAAHEAALSAAEAAKPEPEPAAGTKK